MKTHDENKIASTKISSPNCAPCHWLERKQTFGSISKTSAKATAPRRPPYIITNWSTLDSLWSLYWFAMAVKIATPGKSNYPNDEKQLPSKYLLTSRKKRSFSLPKARKNVQKRMVRTTKFQFQSCLSWMVATPRNMKIIVSEDPLSIFMAYFKVVWDLEEIFLST